MIRATYNHGSSPEDGDGRKKYPGANLTKKDGGRGLAKNISDEKDQSYDVVSWADQV